MRFKYNIELKNIISDFRDCLWYYITFIHWLFGQYKFINPSPSRRQLLPSAFPMSNVYAMEKQMDFGISTTSLITFRFMLTHCSKSCIGDVIVNVFVLSVVGRGFDPRFGQTKDYKIGSFCFSAKHAALSRKSKDWLARNQNNVSG